jgi:transposase-like protein
MKRICKSYDAKLKAKVALEAIASKKELIEISTEHNISKTTICEWRDKLVNEAAEVFVPLYERDKQVKQLKENIEDLHKIIGEVTIENRFLKKKLQR